MKNGIKIYENSDGSFTLEWDKEHPLWSMFNNMTQEQIQDYVNSSLREYVDVLTEQEEK